MLNLVACHSQSIHRVEHRTGTTSEATAASRPWTRPGRISRSTSLAPITWLARRAEIGGPPGRPAGARVHRRDCGQECAARDTWLRRLGRLRRSMRASHVDTARSPGPTLEPFLNAMALDEATKRLCMAIACSVTRHRTSAATRRAMSSRSSPPTDGESTRCCRPAAPGR